MLLSDVKTILDADILTDETQSEVEQMHILTACGCDLMSDVLAFVKEQTLLLTGLINSQVIRTAEMMDIKAVCFVRGKTPPPEVVELANDKGIVLLGTNLPLYTACGKLYADGLGGSSSEKAL